MLSCHGNCFRSIDQQFDDRANLFDLYQRIICNRGVVYADMVFSPLLEEHAPSCRSREVPMDARTLNAIHQKQRLLCEIALEEVNILPVWRLIGEALRCNDLQLSCAPASTSGLSQT